MGAPAGARARHTVATPTARPGAIAVVSIHAGDMDELLGSLGLPLVPVGGVRLAGLLGVDEGLVVRWSRTRVDLTPHAGRRVVRALSEALSARGAPSAPALDPGAMYPEARTPLEARMLDALARAASPRAVDLLLDQPRRWAGVDERAPDNRLAVGRALARLIDPPLVVAVGPPNVGKSTLVNALAGRDVSVVADEPGVTRDAVGALLELDGVCVRYLDAPGLAPSARDELDARAAQAALATLAQADLVVSCHDATAGAIDAALPIPPETPTLAVNTRSDLGEAREPADLRVSVVRGRGVDELARAVRRRLVPDEALGDPRPWRFWA